MVLKERVINKGIKYFVKSKEDLKIKSLKSGKNGMLLFSIKQWGWVVNGEKILYNGQSNLGWRGATDGLSRYLKRDLMPIHPFIGSSVVSR